MRHCTREQPRHKIPRPVGRVKGVQDVPALYSLPESIVPAHKCDAITVHVLLVIREVGAICRRIGIEGRDPPGIAL